MMPPGLSIAVGDPLWLSGRRDWIDTLTRKAGNYTHTTEAVGGYWSANFRLTAGQTELEDWISGGVGRHIVTYDEALSVCWEGFVNRITATAGRRTVTRGPLVDVGNRVYVVYSTIDTSVNPPIIGMRTKTAVNNNTGSQGRWGIRYKVLTTGGMTAANALVVRDRYLAERAEPKQTSQWGGDSSSPGVQVECLGYVHLLNYPYNQTTNTGTIDLSNDDGTGKMQLILAAEPNAIFSTDYRRMVDNTLAVKAYENDDKSAWVLLKGLAAMGDAAYARYLFGIYANRQAVYEAAPTTVAYQRQLRDPKGRITTPEGQEVAPWSVLPGKWLMYVDWMVGRSDPSTQREDTRLEFIESVTFTAPATVTHRGGDTDTLTQLLAQLGLSGIGG